MLTPVKINVFPFFIFLRFWDFLKWHLIHLVWSPRTEVAQRITCLESVSLTACEETKGREMKEGGDRSSEADSLGCSVSFYSFTLPSFLSPSLLLKSLPSAERQQANKDMTVCCAKEIWFVNLQSKINEVLHGWKLYSREREEERGMSEKGVEAAKRERKKFKKEFERENVLRINHQ